MKLAKRLLCSVVRLDWKAYFRRFCREHGEPVESKGRLLFPDGWQYSSTSYGGPEWVPPDDPVELHQVQAAYWKARYGLVKREADHLRRILENLEELQAAKSVPLQQIVGYQDDESGRHVCEVVDLPLEQLQRRLEWLEKDIAECKQHLEEIQYACQKTDG